MATAKSMAACCTLHSSTIGGASPRRNAAESLLQARRNAEHGKVKSYQMKGDPKMETIIENGKKMEGIPYPLQCGTQKAACGTIPSRN